MFYYHILPNRYLPSENLVYASSDKLFVGQVVSITIGKKKTSGIVLKQAIISELGFDPAKIKSITGILPFQLAPHHISFLFSFAYNTFNKTGEVLDAVLQPFADFRQADIAELTMQYTPQDFENNFDANQTNQKSYVESVLDTDILLRIMYIIRISMDKNKEEHSKNLIKKRRRGNQIYLVIVPENSHISAFFEKWNTKFATSTDSDNQVQLFSYSAKTKATQRRTFMLQQLHNTLPAVSIIIGTRSSLFLPFTHLDGIFVADEANNFHIQDQNNVYFDTRDAAFLASQHYKTSLHFVSTLPSIRMHQTYSNTIFKTLVNNVSQKQQKLPEVRYFERGGKEDNFDGIIRFVTEDFQQTRFAAEDEENGFGFAQ